MSMWGNTNAELTKWNKRKNWNIISLTHAAFDGVARSCDHTLAARKREVGCFISNTKSGLFENINMASMNVVHPYYPRDLKLPGYVPNDKSLVEILGLFGAGLALPMLTLWLYSGSLPYLKGRFITRMKICWFLMCGLIHCVVEGYFSIYHRTLAGHQTFFGQMCKCCHWKRLEWCFVYIHITMVMILGNM